MSYLSPVEYVARWDALVEALEDARGAGDRGAARALQRAVNRLEASQRPAPALH